MQIVSKVLTKIFGSRNERLVRSYRDIVAEINGWESRVQAMTDEQLRQRTTEMRHKLAAGEAAIDDFKAEGLAIMRESMDRHIGVRAIFNPDENFDPDKFNDEDLELYDSVQRRMISTGESWKQVPIPNAIYDAVRRLYPESRPPFRARCFDVQLIGGMVLFEGKIAEMATGEGKTFVAPLACFLKCLQGLHCHVVTVNDYLVRRDAEWVRPAFENLGLTVGYLQSNMDPGGEGRQRSYRCNVTYGTNSEFGFDYLRDNMKERADLQVQGPLDYAIVDEVDSILIDEARTPLIISGPAHDDAPKYRAADAVARKVMELHRPYAAAEKVVDAAKRAIKSAQGDADKARKAGDKAAQAAAETRAEQAVKDLEQAEAKLKQCTQYYEVELDRKSVHLTHQGIAAAQDIAGVGSFFVGANMEWPHLMEQSMRAHVVYERDRDYVVERGRSGNLEVIIVDESTGRKLEGRQWSDGLHQAIEAKEKVTIKQETQTLATVTLQNFFKLYKAIAGMTGTAMTEAEEFGKIYRLEVVQIPTNRPMVRQDNEDRVYRTEPEKWNAILEEIKETSDAGRPVLVGTTSVERSETLSKMLTRRYGIEHEVLNAKHHEREAQIIALAGHQHKNAHGDMVGNVTIATNMAGRGTDIKLSPEALKAGGLHVVGTERHTARRIDNQLRGRSGRQGDPGSSRFYISLQDDLMKMFAGEWTIRVLGWLGMGEGMAIEDKRISKGILRAQKKVEERNYLARKNLLEYDEVMNHQRTNFYGMRQRVLEGRDIEGVIWGMIGESISDAVGKFLTQDYVAAVLAEWARINFDVVIDPLEFKGRKHYEDLEYFIKDQAKSEADSHISATLQEFTGDETANQAEWNIREMSSWAMSRFKVNLSQAQIRKMDYEELLVTLKEAALEQIERRDCAPVQRFLDELYAQNELASWAREKFGVEVSAEELIRREGKHREMVRLPAEEVVALIEKRAREAYARREVEYPVDHVLAYAFGEQMGADNPYAADFVRGWVKMKYDVELTLDHVRQTPLRRLRDELIGYQERWLHDGLMDELVSRLIAEHADLADLAKAASERFQTLITPEDLRPPVRPGAARKGAPAAVDSGPGELKPKLMSFGRQFMRRELTQLEQFVLISIFDQSWKDHLYAMDMLRGSVGLHSFAQKDPRILYKSEGFRYFQEMMIGVRDKVTDLIFRARVQGSAQARNAYRETAATHDTEGGYGVGEAVRRTADLTAPPEEGNAEAQAEGVTKTIVRDAPKVGRNDPCPCGSGKKYKKCCGAK